MVYQRNQKWHIKIGITPDSEDIQFDLYVVLRTSIPFGHAIFTIINQFENLSTMKPLNQISNTGAQIVHLADRSKVADEKILVKDRKSIHVIRIADILYCQADGNYSTIYFTNNTSLHTSINLKNLEDKLNGHKFLRIHQSFMCRVNDIVKISSNSIKLISGDELPMSRRKKNQVISAIERR